MCGALHYILDNIFIRFVSRLFRQIIGIQLVLNVLLLLQILFCFVMREISCYLALSDNKQADVIV